MQIKHRGLYPNRFDAPFGIGTLIWAKGCRHHCPDCFHQDRFNLPILEDTAENIIKQVKEEIFSKGIILGGFEWTEQYEELIALIEEARLQDLDVILYTHCTVEEISTNYKDLLKYKGIYIKCGQYENTKLDPTYSSYGIPLASTNQKIYKIGYDI